MKAFMKMYSVQKSLYGLVFILILAKILFYFFRHPIYLISRVAKSSLKN